MQTPPGMSPLYPHKQTLPRATSSALACSSLSGSQRHPESRSLARLIMAKKIFRRQKSHYTAPACGFWIIKIFQFYFSSNLTARPRQCWRLCGKQKLKRLKRISVFFTFKDLRRIEKKRNNQINKGNFNFR